MTQDGSRWYVASPRVLGPHPGRLTLEQAHAMAAAAEEPVEFVVMPALLPSLVQWLESRGIDFVEGPRG